MSDLAMKYGIRKFPFLGSSHLFEAFGHTGPTYKKGLLLPGEGDKDRSERSEEALLKCTWEGSEFFVRSVLLCLRDGHLSNRPIDGK